MILILTQSNLMIQITHLRITKVLLILLLTLFTSDSTAQNLDSLRSLILDRFRPNLTLALEFSEHDFLLEPLNKKIQDPLTESRLVELKDSLEITGKLSYMVRIGRLHIRLNQAKTGQEWLLKALDEYYIALEKDPTSYELLSEVIDLHLALNQYDYAIEKTQRLLENYPNDIDHLVSNVTLRIFSGDVENALQIAEETALKIPDSPSLLFMRTMAMVQVQIQEMSTVEDLAEGQKIWESFSLDLAHLQAAREKYPEKVDVQIAVLASELVVFFYGKILPAFFGGDIGKSGYKFPNSTSDKAKLDFFEREFNALLKHDTFHNKYPIYYSLGVIRILNSKYKKSIPYFERAILEKKPIYRGPHNHVNSSYNNIFAAHAFMGKKEKARISARAKIDDKSAGEPVASHYFELAQLKLTNDEFDAARTLLQETIGIDSTFMNAYVSLANLYMMEGKMELAEEQMGLGQRLNPNSPELYKSGLTYYVYKGDIETSRAMLQPILDYDPKDEFALGIQKILDAIVAPLK
jgi:tetratricopeptide (TPR) repeat protein